MELSTKSLEDRYLITVMLPAEVGVMKMHYISDLRGGYFFHTNMEWAERFTQREAKDIIKIMGKRYHWIKPQAIVEPLAELTLDMTIAMWGLKGD